MTAESAIAISFEAVYAKSKVYIGKALKRKAEGDLEEYQLWASLALELLGKAALAHKHPCLIVDPTHTSSLFVAAGVSATTDVKTITAKTLFDRLKQLAPQFDEPVKDFCLGISERRNSELHSGDVPFKAMKVDAWEARYWYACHIILGSFAASFEDWIGGAEAETPRRILRAKEDATFALVMSKIEAAKYGLLKVSQKEREKKVSDAAVLPPSAYSSMFDYMNEHEWGHKCPACGAGGYLAGDQLHEEISEDEFGDTLWETVERSYTADEFVCPVCSLHLTGSDELGAAGLELSHSELEEREIEYEPDYGNC